MNARKFALGLIGLILLIALPIDAMARGVRPPIEGSMGKYNVVVIGEVTAPEEEGSLQLQVQADRVFHGETETENALAINVDASTLDYVESGKRYIVAYSLTRKHPQFRDIRYLDPKGPYAVGIRGLPFVAVFEAVPPLETLYAGVSEPAKELGLVLELLTSTDERLRQLAALELMFRPDLQGVVTSEQLPVLAEALRPGYLPTQARDYMVQGVVEIPEALRKPWLQEQLMSILSEFGPEMELTSYVPTLTVSTLRGLKPVAEPDMVEKIAPFLYSNAPGVVRAALQAIEAVDEDLAVQTAKIVLVEGSGDPNSERVLRQFLKDKDKLSKPQ